MQAPVAIRFPVISFRKISSPSDDSIGKTYMAVVRIKNLPKEFANWRGLNPRDPKLTSGVSKKIYETLENEPDLFLFKNRGITFLAEKVEYDNRMEELEVRFKDPEMHGLLDGGHTFEVIRSFLADLEEDEQDGTGAMVKIEILEGIQDRNDVISIVEARNTSTQVKEQSIEELRDTFETIKKRLEGQPYEKRIAYKEHEILEDGSRKDIDVKEILSYLICFDTESFDNVRHPIKAYSTKSSLVEHFSSRKESMEKYVDLLPEILLLRDEIYVELPDAYNKGIDGEGGGKFGKLTGVIETSGKKRMGVTKMDFSERESHYRIPSGFIYPILASFRNLVGIRDGKCYWKADPVKTFHELKSDLASKVGIQAKELRNPNKLGKDMATWSWCYGAVENNMLRKGIK